MSLPLSDYDYRMKTCTESLHLAALVWGVLKSPTLREELDESFKTFSVLQSHFLKKLSAISEELRKTSLGGESSEGRKLRMLERLNLSSSDIPDHGYKYSHEYIFGGRLKGVFSASSHSVRTVYRWAMMLSMIAGGWIHASIIPTNQKENPEGRSGQRRKASDPNQVLNPDLLDNNILETQLEEEPSNKPGEEFDSYMLQSDSKSYRFELYNVNLDDSRLIHKDVEKRVPPARKVWVRTLLDIFSNWHNNTTEMVENSRNIVDPEVAKEFDSEGYLAPLFTYAELGSLIDNKRVFKKLIKPNMQYRSDGSGLTLDISRRTVEVLLRAEQSHKIATESLNEDMKGDWNEDCAAKKQEPFYCQEEVTPEIFLMWILGNAMISEEDVYLKLSDVIHHYSSSVMDAKFYQEFLTEVNSGSSFEGFFEGFLEELTPQAPQQSNTKQPTNPLEKEWLEMEKNQIGRKKRYHDADDIIPDYFKRPTDERPKRKDSGEMQESSPQKTRYPPGALPTLNERAPDSEGSNSGEKIDRLENFQSRTITEESLAVAPATGWKKRSHRSMIEAEKSQLDASQQPEDSIFDEEKPILNKTSSQQVKPEASHEAAVEGQAERPDSPIDEEVQNPEGAMTEAQPVKDMHQFSVNLSDASMNQPLTNKLAQHLQKSPSKQPQDDVSGVDNSLFSSIATPFGMGLDVRGTSKADSYMNFTMEKEKDDLEAEAQEKDKMIVVGNESGQLDDSQLDAGEGKPSPSTGKMSQKIIQETDSGNDSTDSESSEKSSQKAPRIITFEDWWCAKLGIRAKSDFDIHSRAYRDNPLAYEKVFEHALHLGMVRELALDSVNKYLTPATQAKIVQLEEFFTEIGVKTVEDTEFIAHSLNSSIRQRFEEFVRQFLKTLSNNENSEINDAKNTSEAPEDSDMDLENFLQLKKPSNMYDPKSEGGASASELKRLQEEKQRNLEVVEKIFSLYLRNQFPKDLESQLTKLVTLPPELLDPHIPTQDEETVKSMKRILRASKQTLSALPALVPNATNTKVKLTNVQWTREARNLCSQFSQESREFWVKTLENMIELCDEVITPGNVAAKKDSIYEKAVNTLRKLETSGANKPVNPNMRMGLNSDGYPVPGDNERHKWFPVRRFKPEYREKDDDSVVSKRIWAKIWHFIENAHWKVQVGFVTWYALLVDGAEWEEAVNTILTRMGFSEVRTIEAAIKLMSILSEVNKSSFAEFPAARVQELNQIPWWVFSGCDHVFGYLEFESNDLNNWKVEFLENLAEWLIKDQQEYHSGYNLDYDLEMCLDSFMGKFRDTYSSTQPIAHFKDRTPLENRNPEQEQLKLKEFRETFTFQLNQDFLIKKGLKRSNGTIKR